MNQDANKREFVRIDDLLPFTWRKVKDDELAQMVAHYDNNRTLVPGAANSIDRMLSALDISDKLAQLEREDPMLASILGQLDMKLNLLLRLWHPDDEMRPLIPTPVNLSGGGMAFWEEQPPLAAGDMLHIRLGLALDSLSSIECLLRVVRVLPDNRDGLAMVACKFEPILSGDRERIIQHIFKKQAENLRARRLRELG